MGTLRFEWDPVKAASSFRKHGVSFDEDRWVLLGMSGAARVLVVVHCERAAGTAVRLISARKADREERDLYAARRP